MGMRTTLQCWFAITQRQQLDQNAGPSWHTRMTSGTSHSHKILPHFYEMKKCLARQNYFNRMELFKNKMPCMSGLVLVMSLNTPSFRKNITQRDTQSQARSFCRDVTISSSRYAACKRLDLDKNWQSDCQKGSTIYKVILDRK